MDTRSKIIEASAAPLDRVIVEGDFDPLLASHAQELQALGQGLIVLVRDREDALMPLRARAELVAAVAAVQFVVPESTDDAFAALSSKARKLNENREELIALIRRKHGR